MRVLGKIYERIFNTYGIFLRPASVEFGMVLVYIPESLSLGCSLMFLTLLPKTSMEITPGTFFSARKSSRGFWIDEKIPTMDLILKISARLVT